MKEKLEYMSFEFYLILAILLIFPLGQLTRVELFSPEIHFYWHDMLVIVLLLHCFIAPLFKKKIKCHSGANPGIHRDEAIESRPQRNSRMTKNRIFRLIISFACFGLFSLFLNSYRFLKAGFPAGTVPAGLQGRSLLNLLSSSLYLMRWLGYTVIYFTVSQFNKERKNKVLEFMIFAGLASVVFGLIQYLFLPDARSLAASGWDPHLYRVIGTFLDPGFTGLIYVFTLILLVDLVWFQLSSSRSPANTGRSRRSKPLPTDFLLRQVQDCTWLRENDKKRVTCHLPLITYYLLLVTCYLALSLTYARSAYLAFLVAIWVFAYFKKSVKFGTVMTLLLLITIFILPRPAGEGVKLERQNSIWSRFDSWKKAVVIAKENPIFGVGFNTYRYIQAEKGFLGDDWQESHAGAGPDSSLLFVLATTGIVGLIVFLSLGARVIKTGLKNLDYRLLTSLAALFIHSFFNNSLFYPWVMIWLWMLLGISVMSIF